MIKPVAVETVIGLIHAARSVSVFYVTSMESGIGTVYSLAKQTDAIIVDMTRDIADVDYLRDQRDIAFAQGRHLVVTDTMTPGFVENKLLEHMAIVQRFYVDRLV